MVRADLLELPCIGLQSFDGELYALVNDASGSTLAVPLYPWSEAATRELDYRCTEFESAETERAR